jgi:hypothetical protein
MVYGDRLPTTAHFVGAEHTHSNVKERAPCWRCVQENDTKVRKHLLNYLISFPLFSAGSAAKFWVGFYALFVENMTKVRKHLVNYQTKREKYFSRCVRLTVCAAPRLRT